MYVHIVVAVGTDTASVCPIPYGVYNIVGFVDSFSGSVHTGRCNHGHMGLPRRSWGNVRSLCVSIGVQYQQHCLIWSAVALPYI